MRGFLVPLLLFTLVGTLAQGVSASEPANSVNFGLAGLNPMPDCETTIYTIEYEHRLTPTMAIVGRGSKVDYRDDDPDFLEDGKLQGVDLGVRYYRSGQLQGFYTGGSLGYWEGDWMFIEQRNTANPTVGNSDSHAIRVNIDLGYRYPIADSNVSVMPEINVGKFFLSSSCDYTAPASLIGAPCDQTSVVNYYIFAGVSLSIAF